MKIIYLLISFILFYSNLNSQITINSGDMASENEEYIVSNSLVVSFDPELTGADYTWDYSELVSFSQDIVGFIDISDASFIYQFTFNNPFNPGFQATEGRTLTNLDLIPGIEIEDAYLFTKNSSTKLEELGYGVTFSGLPLPVQYEDKKTLYNFPLDFENTDNDDYSFNISVPGLGYLGESGNRAYEVDGWGSLTTPFGTFDVLRTKIESIFEDSIHIDSNDFGISIPREQMIYEWLAEEGGIPILQITTEFGIVTSVIYQDSLQISTQINELEEGFTEFIIYPQPAKNSINLSLDQFPQEAVNVILYDLSGKKIGDEIFAPQKVLSINTSHLNAGIYMIEVKIGSYQKIKKLIIQ